MNRKYDEQIGKLRTEKDGVYRVVYRQERLRPGKITEQTGRTMITENQTNKKEGRNRKMTNRKYEDDEQETNRKDEILRTGRSMMNRKYDGAERKLQYQS